MVENLRFAFRGIITHKLRSFLTILGVIIGIASIIGIVSIVEGTNAKLEKSLIGAGNNVVTVALAQDGNEYDMGSNSVPSGIHVIEDKVIEKINTFDGVESASAYRQRNLYETSVYYKNSQLSNGKLYGVSNDFFTTMQYTLVKGRLFKEDEIKKGMKVAMVDSGACDVLFEGADPIGKVLEIKSQPFVVVGVVKDFTKEDVKYGSMDEYYTAMYSGTTANVFIPTQSWPLLFRFDEPQNVAVHADSTSRMIYVGGRVSRLLNSSLSSDDVKYSSLSAQENENNRASMTNTISLMLIGIASLSLLVGGIGVMNIMLVSVTERTSEIGLKKALGAKQRNILMQFLTESVMLTGMGGIIGVLLGIVLAKIISWAVGLEFGISIPWIIISVVFSVIIGAIFGAMPASRAAKMDPIEALRRD